MLSLGRDGTTNVVGGTHAIKSATLSQVLIAPDASIASADDAIRAEAAQVLDIRGQVTSTAGAGIHVNQGDDASDWQISGSVTGRTGIDAESATETITVAISGQVTGTGGTAMVTGSGNDAVQLANSLVPSAASPQIDGDVFLGAGNDSFDMAILDPRLTFPSQTITIDGGSGVDMFNDDWFGHEDITVRVTAIDDGYRFEMSDKSGQTNWTLTADVLGFEAFQLGSGRSITRPEDLAQFQQPAPVPLPASALLLGAAVLGLDVGKRRAA